ncbi:MAG: hypothetical protein HDKAJFGB_04183 [Anaerolineae bacterium]|nr:hypothetical protein [Anaerolineae bacterium]
MKPYRVFAVLRREMQEIVKSRGLLLAIFLPALFLTLLPLGGIAFLGRALDNVSSGDAQDFARLLTMMPELKTWSVGEVASYVILEQFLTMFLMMPLIISLSLASQSVISEKQTKSLEPLLATPIRTSELLLGKGLTAMLPALAATWVAFLIFLLAGRLLIDSPRVYSSLLQPKWLVAMLALAPLLSLLSVSITVVLSSRVNDARTVQQIGGFVVLPIVILGVAQTVGLLLLNVTTFVIGAIILAAADILILRLGVRLFQREKILTRWK